jgi:hypothetical protein
VVTITIYTHKIFEIPCLQIIGKCINIKTTIKRGNIKVCKLYKQVNVDSPTPTLPRNNFTKWDPIITLLQNAS